MSHTRGPWQALQEDKGRNELSRRIHGKSPIYRVESANGGHWFVGYFRRKKDAKLAAAAPDLLEACEALLAGAPEAEHKAKAVIAMARGEGDEENDA